MPTYDYQCRKCGHRFELFHSIKDETPRRCPRCRGKAVRVPAGGAGLLFKGSGFYITDHRSQDYRRKAKEESGGSASKGESSAKPESKSGGEGAAKTESRKKETPKRESRGGKGGSGRGSD